MNVFIYDEFLSEKKYRNTLAKIETRITDLGLNGKIFRLGLLKDISGSIDNEIKRGAKTIIAVGNNQTLSKVINGLCTSNFPEAQNIPVFIIPVGEKNEIAETLGINGYLEACEILSSRRILDFDLGICGDKYFLSSVKISTFGTKIEIDSDYSIEIIEPGEIIINNLFLENTSLPPNLKTSPHDSRLELLINSKKEKAIKSSFSFQKIIIESKNEQLCLDKSVFVKTPAEISLSSKKIRLIVGKNRGF